MGDTGVFLGLAKILVLHDRAQESGRDFRGQVESEFGIDQLHPCGNERRSPNIELDLAFGIGDHRPESRLAPAPSGRRNADGGRDSALDRLRIGPFVVANLASIGRDHADGLRGVHRTPTAQSD